jgi:Flp pilus assembly protein TadG
VVATYQPTDTHSHYGYDPGALKEDWMHNRRAKKKWTLAFDESGATAIVFALIFATLCGVMGLSLDIGHIYKVRAELQRTADAAALAGVTGFLPYTGPPPQTPNWANGVTTANTIVSHEANKVDNPKVTPAATIDYGYWKLIPSTGYVQPPTTGLPKVRPPDAELPQPAINVKLSRDITMYLAPLVGFSNTMTVGATATAILPEGYSIGKLYPVAIEKDLFYDDDKTIHAGEVEIEIKDTGSYYNTDGGNSVPSVINHPLTADPSTTPIYVVPGVKATLVNLKIGDTIILTIVDDINKNEKEWKSIIGFAAFTVTDFDNKTINGHFVNKFYSPDAIPSERPDPATPFISGTPKLVSP